MGTYIKDGLKKAKKQLANNARSSMMKAMRSATRVNSVIELAKTFIENNSEKEFTDSQYEQIIRQLNSYLENQLLAKEVVRTSAYILKDYHTNLKATKNGSI